MSPDPLRIGDVGTSIRDAVMKRAGRASARLQESTDLPVDVLESDDGYLVVFDAPGAAASDVQVRYVEGAVEVRIDRFREFHEGFDTLFPGRGLSLDGAATLPDDAAVDANAATATLTDRGTLEVELPKEDADDEGPDDDAGPDGDDADGTDSDDPAAAEGETDGDDAQSTDDE